jgi:hypothetical protein
VKRNTVLPIIRVPEMAELLVAWLHEARAALGSDQPTADQILMIHAVCRALRIKLPVGSFHPRHGR